MRAVNLATMESLYGYVFLAAGAITFLISLFVDSRKSMPLKFVAIVLAVSGLAILQYAGSDFPTP